VTSSIHESQVHLDVIVVTYNSGEFIGECLESLQAAVVDLCSVNVVVVDNCSVDHTIGVVRRDFPDVSLIVNERNVGFASACNVGIKQTSGTYVLLLNPDVRVHRETVEILLSYLSRNQLVGAAAPQLVGADGAVQPSCRAFPSLLVVLLRGTGLGKLFPRCQAFRRYLMSDWDHASPRAVDWLIGACVMLRRSAIESVGLLDEGFFLDYEDIDWCYRAWALGWQVHYLPQAVAVHFYQRDSARILNRQFTHHLRSIVRLFLKHRFPLL